MRSLGQRIDAAMLTNQDLEAIDDVAYEAKEEELVVRKMVSLKTDIAEGAETYTYKKLTKRGAAKIYAYGGDDIPLVDADVEKVTLQINGEVLGFQVDVQEKRNAQHTGTSIDTTKTTAVRRGMAEKEQDYFFEGDEAFNAEGLINFTGIQTTTVDQNEAGSSTNWPDKTGAEILADIRKIRKLGNTKTGIETDTLGLPPGQYEDLDKPVNADRPEYSIRDYIEEKDWFTNGIYKSSAYEEAGDGSTDAMVAFDSSNDVIEFGLPMDLTRHDPVILPNLAEQVNFEQRMVGAIVRFPLGIVRGDGI
jgi:hypothetical protein